MASQKTKSSVKISPGAVVCDESEIIGDVTIGTRTVIHPKAKIIAEDGPIIIGENNIIEELACIINKAPATASPGSPQAVMIIGNNNVFEVGSCILHRNLNINKNIE
ncbi:DCTN6-like protein [Mya arenaria]|uniref:Dynactin subunit 6 n=1 Tax=Mya arenaria TaxID=6604 RepID=A0ABY7FVY6_MYAAR|nr:DCTN6-like protein [Mya arenaria]